MHSPKKIAVQNLWLHERKSVELIRRLTAREIAIASHVFAGEMDKQIADHFRISYAGVRAHIATIGRKTGCKTRVSIALLVERAARIHMSDLLARTLSMPLEQFIRESIRRKK